MLQINPKKLHGLLKVTYRLLFIYVLFYLEETEATTEQLSKHRDVLLKFENSEEPGAMISFKLLLQKKDKKPMIYSFCQKRDGWKTNTKKILSILHLCVKKISVDFMERLLLLVLECVDQSIN